MMDACANLEEELTIDLPLDLVSLRNIGLVNSVTELSPVFESDFSTSEDEEEPTVVEVYAPPVVYPPNYEPPIGRALKRYFSECRQRARELREYERIQYSHTLAQKCRRMLIRLVAHMKANATAKPWEDYEKQMFGTADIHNT